MIPKLEVQVISRFQPRPQNQVIATNFPVDSTWSDDWNHKNNGPPRGYSFAAIELPGKRFLLTYSLHLKSNIGAQAVNVAKRQEAMKQLLAHSKEMLALYSLRGSCALVVGGDMNTSMDFEKEQTLKAIIASGFHWTFDGVPFLNRITIPREGGYLDNTFDHIFTLGLGKQTASVHPYPGISDHYPVVLDVVGGDFLPKLDVHAGLALLKAKAEPDDEKHIQVTATLQANDHEGIKAAVGKVVAVTGRVQNVGRTRSGSISFINFTGNQRGQFVGIIKKENLAGVEDVLGVG